MVMTEHLFAVAKEDLCDWIEDLRYLAYPAHRRHPDRDRPIEFCRHDLCHTISVVTNAMEQRIHDRSAVEVIPDPDPDPPKPPAARRPRARKATNN